MRTYLYVGVNNTTSHSCYDNTGERIYGPHSSLPPLDQPLPNDWLTIDGEFVNLILTALSHIGTDMHCAPGTSISDGMLNLQYIKRGPKTRKLLKVLTSLETGEHVALSDVIIENLTAFRLVPDVENCKGNITVDGEQIEYGSLQGEVFPSLANVIMMPPVR